MPATHTGAPHEPRARPRPRWRRIVVIGFVALLATTVGAALAGTWFAQKTVNEVLSPKTKQTAAAQKVLQDPLPGKPANILVMGSDFRKNAADDGKRSDTLILVRMNPSTKAISMISFPRDLYVDIPGHGQDRINDAYSKGGPKLAVQTVQQLTDVPIHFIVTVDFRGFQDLVNAVGGVHVDVDRRYLNEGGNYAAIDLQPGYQRLNGKDALAYARYRHTDSDFHRIARQQHFMTALKKRIGSRRELAGNARGLFNVLFDNTDMATGGDGKISVRQAVDYIRLGIALKSNNIYQVQVEGEPATADTGASIVQADSADIAAAVAAFLQPDQDAQQRTADQVGGKPARQEADDQIDPKSITIEVRNGNGVPGSAAEVAAPLSELGYSIVRTGNADVQTYSTARVQYVSETDRALAEQVAGHFADAQLEPAPEGEVSDAKVIVITGKSGMEVAGDAAASQVENNRVPEKQAPKVVTDRKYGLNEFQAISARIGRRLPLLYPTVRESTSTYEFPVRAYRIGNYAAYRLVARTAEGEYWGFQATAWPDPPVLADPTREVTRNGRTYMLYFNGTKLHMVAWRQGGGVFYVTNSLLDKLGNETMMAIADGVLPVSS